MNSPIHTSPFFLPLSWLISLFYPSRLNCGSTPVFCAQLLGHTFWVQHIIPWNQWFGLYYSAISAITHSFSGFVCILKQKDCEKQLQSLWTPYGRIARSKFFSTKHFIHLAGSTMGSFIHFISYFHFFCSFGISTNQLTAGWCFQPFFIFHFIYGIYNPSHWRTPSFFKMVRTC